MTSQNFSAKRAPAVYFAGIPAMSGAEPYHFRLPCPPNWTNARFAGRAPERRAKKAYFAALDAMRTGTVDPEQAAKLGRMLGEATTRSAQTVLAHLVRVMEAASRVAGRRPLCPPPPAPLGAVIATTTLSWAPEMGDPMDRLEWPLEWLRTRRYIVSKGLDFRWQPPRTLFSHSLSAPTPPASALLELLRAD